MGFLDVFQPGSGAPAPGLPPGLLNFIRSQQLAGMATGLLRASGPSRLPVGFGAAMGEGLASAQQAGTRAQEAGYRGLLFQTRREDAERKRQTLGAQRQAVADLGPLARAFPGKYASAKFGAEFREPKESTEPKRHSSGPRICGRSSSNSRGNSSRFAMRVAALKYRQPILRRLVT